MKLRARHRLGSARRRFPLLILALATVSCMPPDPAPRIGVTAARPGRAGEDLEIRFVRCPNEVVLGVALVVPRGPEAGDADDEVLWEIGSSGSASSTFRVGRTPPDFSVETPLEPGSLPDGELAAVVDTSAATAVLRFEAADVRPGQIWSRGRAVEPTPFQQGGLEACRGALQR